MSLIKILTILIISFIISTNALSTQPYTGIICTDENKKIKLEFLFKEKSDGLINVYKRIEGQFIKVGKVVGSKPGSFSLWEDKNAYKGIDFAWHLDKVTGVMRPVVLSTSLKTMKKMPEPLACRAESFWY